VSDVDRLLRPRRVQSGLLPARSILSSNRSDGLWQEEYLMHESEARTEKTALTLTSALPQARLYPQLYPQQSMVEEIPSGVGVCKVTARRAPFWEDVLKFTGISVFRPI
jgi:hypothetical protein